MKSILLIILNVFTFFIVFKINLFGVLPISIDKIFIILGIGVLFFVKKPQRIVFFSRTYFLFILFAIHGVMISLNHNYEINHQVYRFLLFITETYILSFLLFGAYIKLFKKDLKYFYKIVLYCMTIQSILIIFSFLNSSIFDVLDMLTPMGDTNIDEDSFRVYRGLWNNSGSSNSVVLSIGALISLYFFSLENKKRYLIYLLPIFLATAINGRTGVLFIFIFIFIYGYLNSARGQFIRTLVVASLLLIVAQNGVIYFFSQSNRSNQISEWYNQAFEIFDSDKKGGQDAASFKENHFFLPQKKLEVLIGSGIDTDNYSAQLGSDSGIIKNIFSFGLPITIIFYLLLYNKIRKSDKSKLKHERLITIGLILLLIIGETKEPFLLKTFMAKIVLITIIGRNMIFKQKMIV